MFTSETRHQWLGPLFMAVVGLLLSWPVLTWVGLFPWKFDTFENRRPAVFPTQISSLEDWVQWPRRFESYLDDRLPNRGALMSLNAWVKLYLFATSPVDNVLVGKDGWLFHRMPADMLEFEGRLQRQPYQMRRLRVVLEERHDWLAERGIEYLVLIAPTKQTVYPEKMPDWLSRSNLGRSRRELFLAELQRAESELELFDFTPRLLAAKARWGDELFYPQDSHWTYVGAVHAYKALAERFPAWFREPDPDWVEVPTPRKSNLMQLMGLSSQVTTPYPQPSGGFAARTLAPDTGLLRRIAERGSVSVYHSPDAPEQRLYFMGDSFAGWDTDYLAENFTRTVLTNTWGNQWQRHEQFPIEAIAAEGPDLVIEQMVENRLDLGVPRALLGDPAGENHPPEVRSARLRRLLRAEGEMAADFRLLGDEIEIVAPAAEAARAYIVRLDLEVGEEILIESFSPYSDAEAWDDLCRRGGELTRYKVAPGLSEVLLCAAVKTDATALRLKLNPAGRVQVSGVRISQHPDV